MIANILFAVLLALNAVLLAAGLGALGPMPLDRWGQTPREAERASRQVHPERFGLLPLSGTDARAAAVAARVDDMRCVEVGGADEPSLRRIAEELGGGAARIEAFERTTPQSRDAAPRWWVHLPAQPSREQIERKLAELRRRKITDVAVVSAGQPGSYVVSLGLFRERERAERFLESLREQGVRTAVLSESPRAAANAWLRVRDADPALRARLDDMRRRYGVEVVAGCA
jgi:cell division septation protein DedD